jgi:hypothetical protein
VVYALTAVSGYLLFGEDTESDVLTNFDKNLGIRFSTLLNYIVRTRTEVTIELLVRFFRKKIKCMFILNSKCLVCNKHARKKNEQTRIELLSFS